MYTNNANGASYNFVAPNVPGDAGQVVKRQFPTFEKKTVTLSSNAGSVTIERTKTLVDISASNLAAATTLTATAKDIDEGSVVYVKFKCGGTAYNVTVKKDSDDTGVVLAGTASTTSCKSVMWDGSAWVVLN
jgi:archaellin